MAKKKTAKKAAKQVDTSKPASEEKDESGSSGSSPASSPASSETVSDAGSSDASLSSPASSETVSDAGSSDASLSSPAKPDVSSDSSADTEALVRARDGAGKFLGDDPATQQNEAFEPPLPVSVSKAAHRYLRELLLSYFGKTGAEEVEPKVLEGLAAGKQVFIVKGKENKKFGVSVVAEDFDPFDATTDASVEGGLVNISRTLTDAKLYPSS